MYLMGALKNQYLPKCDRVGDDASIFRLFQAVFKSFKVLGSVQKSLNHFWIRKRDIQLTGLYTLLHTYK